MSCLDASRRALRSTITELASPGGGALAAVAVMLERVDHQLSDTDGVEAVLAELRTPDDYMLRHSIGVTVVGLLIGQKYFRRYGWVDFTGVRHYSQIDERLTSLGLGLLLHDIGKLALPESIVNKPGRLTPEEWELMTTHPRAGVELLAGTDLNPLVTAIVLRHHERWDGGGYPDGKGGEEIHQMGRIAAVAEVFGDLVTDSPYARAAPSPVCVQVIRHGAGTLFDPDVVEAFMSVVPPFPPGSPIKLTDGRSGVVVTCPERALDRPVVRILANGSAPHEIALLDNPELSIVGWPTLS